MEVHHHPDLHRKKKNFKEYFLEFLMIFLAVFLGFIAENIREKISDKAMEKEYMESLVSDLKADTSAISEAIDEWSLANKDDIVASNTDSTLFMYASKTRHKWHFSYHPLVLINHIIFMKKRDRIIG